VSWVALRPCTIPDAVTPSRSEPAARKPLTAASAFASEAPVLPRLESGPLIVAAIAAATSRGVWVPPGPSKWAVPNARDGKWVRNSATS